ncbi:hypothetical protein JTB14_001342 [Gonioctena quinquepunctata]|nr:hypothetical protein JTB14_001342 [Gonioctena quinquepunctata]
MLTKQRMNDAFNAEDDPLTESSDCNIPHPSLLEEFEETGIKRDSGLKLDSQEYKDLDAFINYMNSWKQERSPALSEALQKLRPPHRPTGRLRYQLRANDGTSMKILMGAIREADDILFPDSESKEENEETPKEKLPTPHRT